MMRRRKKIDVASLCGLTHEELSRLARFDDERDHGIVHTDEYLEQMVILEIRLDKATTKRGITLEIKDGYPYLVDHFPPGEHEEPQ
jgi:hypothetical protein